MRSPCRWRRRSRRTKVPRSPATPPRGPAARRASASRRLRGERRAHLATGPHTRFPWSPEMSARTGRGALPSAAARGGLPRPPIAWGRGAESIVEAGTAAPRLPLPTPIPVRGRVSLARVALPFGWLVCGENAARVRDARFDQANALPLTVMPFGFRGHAPRPCQPACRARPRLSADDRPDFRAVPHARVTDPGDGAPGWESGHACRVPGEDGPRRQSLTADAVPLVTGTASATAGPASSMRHEVRWGLGEVSSSTGCRNPRAPLTVRPAKSAGTADMFAPVDDAPPRQRVRCPPPGCFPVCHWHGWPGRRVLACGCEGPWRSPLIDGGGDVRRQVVARGRGQRGRARTRLADRGGRHPAGSRPGDLDRNPDRRG